MRGERLEYRLTEKGLNLRPTIVALLQLGDSYAAPNGPPDVLTNRGCGGEVDGHRICSVRGKRLTVRDVKPRPGPGAKPDVAWPALRGDAKPVAIEV
jgi:hypothetical protein